jgi:hypothetical protein
MLRKLLKYLGVNFTICDHCALYPARKNKPFCSEECEHRAGIVKRVYG